MTTPDAAKTDKSERRKFYRPLQKSFSAEQYSAWNAALAAPLLEIGHRLPKGARVAVYFSKGKEASLAPLFKLPLRFCFPKILDREGIMEFREVEKVENEEFALGPFGIYEPQHWHPTVTKEELHVAFIPLLAFDAAGRRLGQGKGFYDRFLHGFTGERIGVGFGWQGSPTPLPIDGHDEPLHALVTEHGTQRFSNP